MDVGAIQFYAPISTVPSTAGVTATASTGTTLGIGTYLYKLVWATGNKRTNGQFTQSGHTLPSSAISVTTTSGNQAVSFGSLPTTWPTGAYLQLFRTAVGGADGTEKLVTTLLSPLSTYVDTLADASLGAAIPTSNTTGTYLPGINALNVTSWLSSLLYFTGTLITSRGVSATFTRTTPAYNPETLSYEGASIPSFVTGYWGDPQGAMTVWEGTTNLAHNSDFETVTVTATLFSDPLTSGAAWTTQSGSFTYSSSGAAGAATGSLMTAGNPVWKPLLGSNVSTSLPLTVQATFTQPATVGNQHLGLEQSWVGGETAYRVEITGGTMYLTKVVSGTPTNLATVAETLAASTTYTMTLELDHLGNLTAKLYSGSGTGGTLLQTLTATDTSLSGGFLVGVGGDTGVIVSNASMVAPWANGWAISGDTRVAWGLTTNAINGTYSMSAVGIPHADLSPAYASVSLGLTLASAQATAFSCYLNTTNVGASGAFAQLDTTGGTAQYVLSTKIVGTNATERVSTTFTTSSGTTSGTLYLALFDSGTAVFDCAQVENLAYATPYLRNDSTSATATRAAESLTIPTTGMSASAGAIAGWFRFDNSTFATSALNPFRAIDDSNDGYGFLAYGTTLSLKAANGVVSYTLPGSLAGGTWVHLAVAWNGSTVCGYVNGALVGTATQGTTALGATWDIGHLNGGQQMDGAIDDLALLRICPSALQIATLYAASQPPVDSYSNPTVDPVIYSMLY